jgi:glucosamine-6-phosphate deaminase
VKRTLIKYVSLTLLLTFSFQDITSANPAIFEKNNPSNSLQTPAFVEFADPIDILRYKLKELDVAANIETFRLCIYPVVRTPKGQVRLIIDFANKHQQADGSWIIPCRFGEPTERFKDAYEAVIRPKTDTPIEVRAKTAQRDGGDHRSAAGPSEEASVKHEMLIEPAKDFSAAAAKKVADEIRRLQRELRRDVNIVFATGNTMVKFLNALALEEGINWRKVRAFHLDEYAGLATDEEHSFAYFLYKNLFSRVDIPRENIFYIDGKKADEAYGKSSAFLKAYLDNYMERLKALGGADIVMLGVGMDGHLAFNEPPKYSSFASRIQRVRLDKSTIDANRPDYPLIEKNPFAYTMGMADIYEGKRLFFMANGPRKAAIVQKSLEGPVTKQVPASLIQRHPNVTIILDTDAAAKLKKYALPRKPALEAQKLRNCVDKEYIQSFSGIRYDKMGLSSEIAPEERAMAFAYGYNYMKLLLDKKPRQDRYRIIIGRDPRPTGEAIAKDQIRGMRASAMEEEKEIEFVYLGIITTPLFESAIRTLDADGGVMITASHNPLEHNGYKYATANREPGEALIARGSLLSAEDMEGKVIDNTQRYVRTACDGDIGAMAALLEKIKPGDIDSVLLAEKNSGYYKKAVAGYVKELREFLGETDTSVYLVNDYNRGSSARVNKEVLTALGFNNVRHMWDEFGKRPAHIILPEGDALIDITGELTKRKPKSKRAKVGIVYDFDADRGNLVLLKPDGTVSEISPQDVAALNVMIALVLNQKKAKRLGKKLAVVGHCATSLRTKRIAEKFGAEFFTAEVGEVNMVAKMAELESPEGGGYLVPIGVEGYNGGTIFRGSMCRDGLQTLLTAAKVLSEPGIYTEWLDKAGLLTPSLEEKIKEKMASGDFYLDEVVASLPRYETRHMTFKDVEVSKTEMEKRLIDMKSGAKGNYRVKGLPGKTYQEIRIEYSGGTKTHPKSIEDKAGEGLEGNFVSGGWKVLFLDTDGEESQIWLRGSKTEKGKYNALAEARSRQEAVMLENLLKKLCRPPSAREGAAAAPTDSARATPEDTPVVREGKKKFSKSLQEFLTEKGCNQPRAAYLADNAINALQTKAEPGKPEQLLKCFDCIVREITGNAMDYELYLGGAVPRLAASVKDLEKFELFLPIVTELTVKLRRLGITNMEPVYAYGIPEAAKKSLTTEIFRKNLEGVETWSIDLQIEDVVSALALELGKPLRDLQDEDFIKKGLGWLFDKRFPGGGRQAAAYVEARIREKVLLPGDDRNLPKGKTIIIYATHPDDEIVPAGLIQRLIRKENRNRVVIFFATPGYTAVRGLDPKDPAKRKRAAKIRAAEMIAACRRLGVKEWVFLDLPFYHFDPNKRVVKNEDVRKLSEALEGYRPDILLLPGDLNDPHNTHSMTTDVMEMALKRRVFTKELELWYYKGAWTEYTMHNADVFVTVSREEMRSKRDTAKRHLSQMDPLFPGDPLSPGTGDYREFYERLEARNLDTANRLRALGILGPKILGPKDNHRYHDIGKFYRTLMQMRDFMEDLAAARRTKRKALGEPVEDGKRYEGLTKKRVGKTEKERILSVYERKRLKIHQDAAIAALADWCAENNLAEETDRALKILDIYHEYGLTLDEDDDLAFLKRLCDTAKLSGTGRKFLADSIRDTVYVEAYVVEKPDSHFRRANMILAAWKKEAAERSRPINILESLRKATFLCVEQKVALSGPYKVIKLFASAMDDTEVERDDGLKVFRRAVEIIAEEEETKGERLLLDDEGDFNKLDDIITSVRDRLRREGIDPTRMGHYEDYLKDVLDLAMGRLAYSIKLLSNDDVWKITKLLEGQPIRQDEFIRLFGYILPYQKEKLRKWYGEFIDTYQIETGKRTKNEIVDLLDRKLDFENPPQAKRLKSKYYVIRRDIFLKGERCFFEDIRGLYKELARLVFVEDILNLKGRKVPLEDFDYGVYTEAMAFLTAFVAAFGLECAELLEDKEKFQRSTDIKVARLRWLLKGMQAAFDNEGTAASIRGVMAAARKSGSAGVEEASCKIAGILLWQGLKEEDIAGTIRPDFDYLANQLAFDNIHRNDRLIKAQNHAALYLKDLILGYAAFTTTRPPAERELPPKPKAGYTRHIATIALAGRRVNFIGRESVEPELLQPPAIAFSGEKESDRAKMAELEKTAEAALRKGSVGLVTMAGGLASRLGGDTPKGMLSVSPLSGKTIFETQAEELKAVRQRYGRPVAWFIMTSEANDVAIREYFKKKKWFGLVQGNVIFIKQESEIAIEAGTLSPGMSAANTAMKEENAILTAPNGNGGIYRAMKSASARTDGEVSSALEEEGDMHLPLFERR